MPRQRARAETDAGRDLDVQESLVYEIKAKISAEPNRPEHIQKTLAVVAANCILHATWTWCCGRGEA